MELLRVRHDEQARGERRKQASLAIESAAVTFEAVARGRDAAPGRRQRPVPAGRVRRRPPAGEPGRRTRRIPRPGRVLPAHLPDREPQGHARRRGASGSPSNRRAHLVAINPCSAPERQPVERRHRTRRTARARRGPDTEALLDACTPPPVPAAVPAARPGPAAGEAKPEPCRRDRTADTRVGGCSLPPGTRARRPLRHPGPFSSRTAGHAETPAPSADDTLGHLRPGPCHARRLSPVRYGPQQRRDAASTPALPGVWTCPGAIATSCNGSSEGRFPNGPQDSSSDEVPRVVVVVVVVVLVVPRVVVVLVAGRFAGRVPPRRRRCARRRTGAP